MVGDWSLDIDQMDHVTVFYSTRFLFPVTWLLCRDKDTHQFHQFRLYFWRNPIKHLKLKEVNRRWVPEHFWLKIYILLMDFFKPLSARFRKYLVFLRKKRHPKIVQKYAGKLLGQRDWASPVKIEFYLEDFLDKRVLFDFISEIESYEADFTIDGYHFISDYYGVRNLAKELFRKDPDYPTSSILENQQLLERCLQ